ncbi:MAG: arylsulfatase [Rikenellaceae bacterium]
MRNPKLYATLGCALCLVPSVLEAKSAPKKPNVILILTDDVGYGDVGYTGNKIIKTPAIDKLHSQSICFDNFQTGTTSAPTRSGLMTGVDGNLSGVWHTISGRSILDTKLYTMGDAFKDNGYTTAMYGKWHLGDNYPYRPIDRGFDNVLCLKGGGIGQLPDYWGNTYFDDTYYRDRDIPEKQTGYCTDVFVDETIDFISKNKKKPFFVYLALNAAHAPFNVEAKYVEPYKDKVSDRTARIYGMIANIDENIAKLRESLKKEGLDDNTVIILFGDNGSNVPVLDKQKFAIESKGYNGGLRGRKGDPWDGGHRQAMLMYLPWENKGIQVDDLTMYYDLMPTLMSMCNLKPSREVNFDGVDIFAKDFDKDRIEVTDTQRGEFLVKYKEPCVMKGHWRLVYGKELYNVAKDRSQRNDVAAQNPKLVKELAAAYEKWWDKISVDKDYRHPVYLSTDVKGESVVMNSHDAHSIDPKVTPIWNQGAANLGKKTPAASAFWTVKVTEAGVYDFELYRWNPVTGLNLNAQSPAGRPVPNSGNGSKPGRAIMDMKSAKIVVNGVEVASCEGFSLDKPSISIHNVKLEAGIHEFKPIIVDSKGNEFLPWFVKSTKK